jgi:hypothetical protein
VLNTSLQICCRSQPTTPALARDRQLGAVAPSWTHDLRATRLAQMSDRTRVYSVRSKGDKTAISMEAFVWDATLIGSSFMLQK